MWFCGSEKIATEFGPSCKTATYFYIPFDPNSLVWLLELLSILFPWTCWTFPWFHCWFHRWFQSCWQFALPAINPLAMRAPQSSPQITLQWREIMTCTSFCMPTDIRQHQTTSDNIRQPRQCMAGTYCLSLSLHLAGQNFPDLQNALSSFQSSLKIAGIAGPCNSSTSAPSALIFPDLQILQSPSQSFWRLVQFVHTHLEFAGCTLLLAASSPALHPRCSVGLVLQCSSHLLSYDTYVLPRDGSYTVLVMLQGDARAASSAGTGLCPPGSANLGRGAGEEQVNR